MGLASLAVLALAAQAAWLHARADDLELAALLLIAACDAAIVAGVGAALRHAPVVLRWDTRCWWLEPADAPHPTAVAGRLRVALDLGPWMLLAFVPEGGRCWRGTRTAWLPVQRRGLESHWHALRCAVYCARPAPPGGAALDAGQEPKE